MLLYRYHYWFSIIQWCFYRLLMWLLQVLKIKKTRGIIVACWDYYSYINNNHFWLKKNHGGINYASTIIMLFLSGIWFFKPSLISILFSVIAIISISRIKEIPSQVTFHYIGKDYLFYFTRFHKEHKTKRYFWLICISLFYAVCVFALLHWIILC